MSDRLSFSLYNKTNIRNQCYQSSITTVFIPELIPSTQNKKKSQLSVHFLEKIFRKKETQAPKSLLMDGVNGFGDYATREDSQKPFSFLLYFERRNLIRRELPQSSLYSSSDPETHRDARLCTSFYSSFLSPLYFPTFFGFLSLPRTRGLLLHLPTPSPSFSFPIEKLRKD